MKLFLVIILLVLSGCGPQTYEDCILENVTASMSNAAVKVIKDSCRKKFPKPEAVALDDLLGCHDTPLTQNELRNIKLSVYSNTPNETHYSLINKNNFSVKAIKIEYNIKGSNINYTDLIGHNNQPPSYDEFKKNQFSMLDFNYTFKKLQNYLITPLPSNISSYRFISGFKQICEE